MSITSDQPDTFAPTSGNTAADGTFSAQIRGRTAGTQTLSYNGLPWPDTTIGEQKDAAAADLNHDGIMDVVTLEVYGTISVILGKGGRAWKQPVTYNSVPP